MNRERPQNHCNSSPPISPLSSVHFSAHWSLEYVGCGVLRPGFPRHLRPESPGPTQGQPEAVPAQALRPQQDLRHPSLRRTGRLRHVRLPRHQP